MNWEPLILSLKLAMITTLLLLIIGVMVAYWLAYTKTKVKPFIEAVISLPLVLPPSVLGFYLLLAFSPGNLFGKFLEEHFDVRLAFSFEGLIIASLLYSLPFMVHPIQAGFQNLSSSLKEAAYTLGISPFQTLLRVLIPNIRPSILSGIVLTFAHTLGEFGVIMMIGGNIPGETQVASIAIYDEVESMNYGMANTYAEVLLVFSFVLLSLLFFLNKSSSKKGWFYD